MAQGLMDIGTGTANTISGAIIVPLIQKVIQEIDDVIHLDENRRLLEEQLNRMKSILRDINDQFRDQQREAPVSLKNCLERMQREVQEGRELIDRSQRLWLQQYIDWLLCKPRVSTQVREWKTTINGLFDELRADFLLLCSAQQIVSGARQQEGVLLQDLPDTGLIGMKIKDAETQLQRWASEALHIHIIGLYGMGGVGKTTLLKKVYNTYKQVSCQSFDHVIWVTVSQFPILQMQNDIASTINLDLANCSADMRKMKLSAYMKTKKFFLVLDDLWSAVNLKELGVEFGIQGSKLVFSTRNRDLIREMNAQESMQLQPLSTEEAWELFSKVAFKDGHVPKDMEGIAREVAHECKGLPLAINVIASTMSGNSAVNEWNLALKQMQKVDLNFPLTHPRIDRDLYQRLRWSYDSLPNTNLKNCFLYCALCPEDIPLQDEFVVQTWIAEGLVQTRDGDYDYLVETAYSYVKLLENRCLFNVNSSGPLEAISVHDVVRDMAIYIGEREENCVSRAGQRLQDFPDMESIHHDCRRISVWDNKIASLPAKELRCSKLVTLILRQNRELQNIPHAFLSNLTSLQVLDLCETHINSLPTSVWQLIQLQYLDLSYTQIETVPQEICNLSQLRYLFLEGCAELKELSSQVGELKNLKNLNLEGCSNLKVIPDEIKMLQSCTIIMQGGTKLIRRS